MHAKSARSGSAATISRLFANLIHHVLDFAAAESHYFGAIREYAADFLDCAAGADIVRANAEDHAIDEAKRVIEHETFHFAVIFAAPV